MPLYYFLLLVVSLGSGSLPALERPWQNIVSSTLMLVSGWCFLSHVSARWIANQVQREALEPLPAAILLERVLSFFRWSGLIVAIVCLAGFGLGRVVTQWPWFESSLLLQSFVLLAPAFAMTASTWSAEHLYGVQLGYTDPSFAHYYRSLVTCFRNSSMWILIPILAVLLTADVVSLFPFTVRTANLVTGSLILIGIPTALPLMMRYLFKTRPLSSTDEAWIHDVLVAVGIRPMRVLEWDTGRTSYNALVIGFLRSARTMLISDRLLSEMTREELAMVVLHEAAHLRRRHMPLRILSVIPAWLSAGVVTHFASHTAWGIPVGTIVGISLTLLLLKSVGYRTEFDADAIACELAEKIATRVRHVPNSAQQAGLVLGRALQRLGFANPSASEPSWMHPGIGERIKRLTASPAVDQSTTEAGSFLHCPAE
jgi:Zn-dependent protease with chaperone function